LVTVSKRLELPPSSAVVAVQRWWREHEQAPWLAAGRDRLELDHPDASAILGYLYRLFGRLHLHHTWPTVHVELDLSAWSFSESELELRPQRIPRGSYREARFFAAAHAVVEELARQVTATTTAPTAATATLPTG
jgi:hypothetical protein